MRHPARGWKTWNISAKVRSITITGSRHTGLGCTLSRFLQHPLSSMDRSPWRKAMMRLWTGSTYLGTCMEAGSSITQGDLNLTVPPRMIVTFRPPCLHHGNAGIIGVRSLTQFSEWFNFKLQFWIVILKLQRLLELETFRVQLQLSQAWKQRAAVFLNPALPLWFHANSVSHWVNNKLKCTFWCFLDNCSGLRWKWKRCPK